MGWTGKVRVYIDILLRGGTEGVQGAELIVILFILANKAFSLYGRWLSLKVCS